MKLKNIAGMAQGLLFAYLWGKKTPLNVMLSVTNRCTSNCSYCNIPSRRQKELSTDQIFSLIDQLRGMGCQRLGLWGGEPLIRQDIGQIIDYAKGKGLFVTLDSNGYLLPQKIEMLKNLDHLILALDGDERAHDANRGTGSFKKVMEAIDLASGRIPFWTITVLTKNNLHCVDFILAKAQEFGFLATFQLLHHNERLSRNQKELIPSAESYRKVIEKLIREKKKGAPIASSSSYLKHILEWPDYTCPTSSGKINNLQCWAGKVYCNVDTDGLVYPCSLSVGKIEALNFLDVGFKKAFASLQFDSCQGCLASCFIEYNNIYSLNFRTIFEWLEAFRQTRNNLCKKKI